MIFFFQININKENPRWLYESFQEKEQMLQGFTQSGTFPDPTEGPTIYSVSKLLNSCAGYPSHTKIFKLKLFGYNFMKFMVTISLKKLLCCIAIISFQN